MANLPTEYKRLFLRSLLWDSQETQEGGASGSPLYEAIKTAARARIADTATGKVLVSMSANNKSASYSIPSLASGFSPSDLTTLCEELIARFEEAQRFLVARGTASPTDAETFEEMLALLHPVKSLSSDFSMLRL